MSFIRGKALFMRVEIVIIALFMPAQVQLIADSSSTSNHFGIIPRICIKGSERCEGFLTLQAAKYKYA